MSLLALKKSMKQSARLVGIPISDEEESNDLISEGGNNRSGNNIKNRYSLETPPSQHMHTQYRYNDSPFPPRKMFTYHDQLMSLEERWSEERFQDMARLWKLSTDERKGMKELLTRVEDIHHWKNDPYEIIRFYKEFKGNLPKVEKIFRYMIKWRQENDIDTHMERYGNPDPMWEFLPLGILEESDKEGDPIYLDRMGVADQWGLLKHFKVDNFVDYIIYFNEMLNSRSFWKDYEEREGKRVSQFTVLIDLGGLNAGHMRPGLLPLLQRLARINQDCYAGWAKRLILLRAPKIFYYIWTIAKHFFDQHIQDMIVLTNHENYLDVISEYVDLESLPSSVAPGIGRGQGMGIFVDKEWEGGPIPTPAGLQERLKARERNSLLKNQGFSKLNGMMCGSSSATSGSTTMPPSLKRVDSDTSTALSTSTGRSSPKSSVRFSSQTRGSTTTTCNVYGGSMLKGYWRVAPEVSGGKFFVVWPSKDATFQ